MRLHIMPHCIIIRVAENSPFSLHVKTFLSENLSRSFWVNETLINICTPFETQKRQAFLTKLYYTCAQISRTHDASFLKKLLLSCHKPIKLMHTKRTPSPTPKSDTHTKNPYHLLKAHPDESLHTIRKKYLQLAKEFHPDTLVDENPLMRQRHTEMFQHIQEAYATIKAEKIKENVA